MNSMHNQNKINNVKPAFTIIEVVLVLAIAGLIFLMVFIALPALQRNQRDTQRRNDMGRAISAVQDYQANNRGQVPQIYSGWNQNLRDVYLKAGGSTFQDPDGSDYTFDNVISNNRKNANGATNIFVSWNSGCQGSEVVSKPGENNVALLMILEGGGRYCVNN